MLQSNEEMISNEIEKNKHVSFDVSEADVSEPEYVSVGKLFGLSDEDSRTRKIFRFPDVSDPFVPRGNPHYCFRKSSLYDLLSFLMSPNGDALFITGPTGSGKTSLVLETAARLNYPVQSVTINGRMEFAELRGLFTICSPSPGEAPQTVFKYGPLVNAMLCGHILLLNELDLADPAELAGLNDVLEGRPLIIAENGGEVIYPHPSFRVIATGNSSGCGDESGLYQGVIAQNLACMDRFRFMKVDYAQVKVERGIAKRLFPDFPTETLDKMIQLANEIRKAFVGGSEGLNRTSITMSTRTLIRWMHLSVQLKSLPGVKNSLRYALDLALLNRANPQDQETIRQIAFQVFGQKWNNKA